MALINRIVTHLPSRVMSLERVLVALDRSYGASTGVIAEPDHLRR